MVKKLLCVGVCLCLAAGTLLAQSEDKQLVDAARKTLQSYDKALISLSAVLKLEAKGIEGMSQEQKTQCAATIIDPSGLAVTSLTNLNPQNAIPKMRIRRGNEMQTLELDCQVQEVKYRLNDGTEVPAHIVLKDEDLDLVFLAPLKALDAQTQAKIAVLSLENAASKADMLDSTILINRSSEDLNYVPMINLGRIAAVLSQPRTCYLSNMGTIGTPVFDQQGKVIGIICRCIKVEGGEGDSMRTASAIAATSRLILPAADVVKLMPQAKEEMKKSAETEKKPADAEKKPADAEKKPADAEKKPAEAEKKPEDAEKKPAEAEKK
jgi:hypothetical protein